MGDFGMGMGMDMNGGEMEEMMMAMMLGDMMSSGFGDENDMEEAMAKEFA